MSEGLYSDFEIVEFAREMYGPWSAMTVAGLFDDPESSQSEYVARVRRTWSREMAAKGVSGASATATAERSPQDSGSGGVVCQP